MTEEICNVFPRAPCETFIGKQIENNTKTNKFEDKTKREPKRSFAGRLKHKNDENYLLYLEKLKDIYTSYTLWYGGRKRQNRKTKSNTSTYSRMLLTKCNYNRKEVEKI